MRNCILFGYRNQVVSGGGFNTLDEDYNLYFSNQGSVGYTLAPHSLISNPMFVNAAGNDYHLQQTSAAIDAGLTLPFVPKDFDGKLRPQGAGYDIGAYEFVAVTSQRPNPPSGLRIVSIQ
jgi:hypothetical protein